jgi:hypothetical protein
MVVSLIKQGKSGDFVGHRKQGLSEKRKRQANLE